LELYAGSAAESSGRLVAELSRMCVEPGSRIITPFRRAGIKDEACGLRQSVRSRQTVL